MADGSYLHLSPAISLSEISKLPTGTETRFKIPRVSTRPGGMALCLQLPPEDGATTWQDLYWYEVQPEEKLARLVVLPIAAFLLVGGFAIVWEAISRLL